MLKVVDNVLIYTLELTRILTYMIFYLGNTGAFEQCFTEDEKRPGLIIFHGFLLLGGGYRQELAIGHPKHAGGCAGFFTTTAAGPGRAWGIPVRQLTSICGAYGHEEDARGSDHDRPSNRSPSSSPILCT